MYAELTDWNWAVTNFVFLSEEEAMMPHEKI